jgi:hypothetical protein
LIFLDVLEHSEEAGEDLIIPGLDKDDHFGVLPLFERGCADFA